MKLNRDTRVSVYVKGNDTTPEYYRIYQYLYRIPDIECRYHMMMSHWVYLRFMPVSKQSVLIKIFVYLHQFFRMLFALVYDNVKRPDVVVIHKRIISRFMPQLFKWLLKRICKKGTRLIWDFDDHILESKDVSNSIFRLFASLSEKIVVTHQFLADLVPIELQYKVRILPTTDGDMACYAEQSEISESRMVSLQKSINLIWIGTSFNLPHLENVMSHLEYAAEQIEKNENRNVSLTIVCNKPLEAKTVYLRIRNIAWERTTAINELKKAHIGIMPLSDNVFNRGKGGFKLVQYLAIALPCIGSDVGFNSHVIDQSCGILLADNRNTTWLNAIKQIGELSSWQQYSIAAFNKWEKEFSFNKNLAFWTKAIKSDIPE